MARDEREPTEGDPIAEIADKIERATSGGGQHDDRRVATLLVRLALDPRYIALADQLIDAIEDRHGRDAQRILGLMRRRCEAQALAFEAAADDAEEAKTGTWAPALATTLGAGLAATVAAIAPEDPSPVTGIASMALFAFASLAWVQRRSTHRIKREAANRAGRMRIVASSIERRTGR